MGGICREFRVEATESPALVMASDVGKVKERPVICGVGRGADFIRIIINTHKSKKKKIVNLLIKKFFGVDCISYLTSTPLGK